MVPSKLMATGTMYAETGLRARSSLWITPVPRSPLHL